MTILSVTTEFLLFNDVSTAPGEIPWQNVSGLASYGGNAAYCPLKVSNKSYRLIARSPSTLGIPSTAIIVGLEFIIRKYENSGANIVDRHVYIRRGSVGVQTTKDLAMIGYWPTSATELHYGGPSELWGLSGWDTTKLDSDYGVAIQVQTGTDGISTSTAYIDHIYGKIYYTVGESLTVSLTPSPTSGTAPLDVSFAASISGGVAPYTINWNFGDGTTIADGGTSQTHTYTTTGTYTATISVADSGGNTGQTTATISVSGSSTLQVSLSVSPTSGVSPLTVMLGGSAVGGTGPYTYLWNFGDGTTSTASPLTEPTHVYTSVGTYTVYLTATDSLGNNGTSTGVNVTVTGGTLLLSASATPTTGPTPLGVNFTCTASGGTEPYTYYWTSGAPDGGTGTTQTWSHAYTTPGTYQAEVQCTDAAYNVATAFVTITVQPATSMAVAISAIPSSGTSPLSVAFSSAVTNGVAPYTYLWKFGDGLTDTTADPAHTYYPGTYNAYVQVWDSTMPPEIFVTSNTIVITVTGSGGLSVTGTAVPLSGPAPLAVSFSGSVAGGTGPYTYLWDFGDGTTDPNSTASHSYVAEGTYTASLAAQDSAGISGISSMIPITVTGSGVAGSGDAFLSWIGSDDDTAQANLLYSYYLEPLEATWGAWVSDTSHTYPNLPGGVYTFHVQCQDQTGLVSAPDTCTFTWAGVGFLQAYIQEDIHYSATVPATVNFVGSATGGVAPYTYSWDFGDTASGSGDTVSHTYTGSGQFTVTLTVTDSNTASTTVTATKYIGVTEYSISGTIQDSGRAPLIYVKGNQDVGQIAWVSKTEAVTPDSVGAFVQLTGTKTSYYLVAKMLSGTSVPLSEPITGLEVWIHRQGSTVQDKRITPIRDGLLCDGLALAGHGADHTKVNASAWAATWEWVQYGGPGDLWGFPSLDAAQLTTKRFGIAIQAQPTGSSGGTANVDSVLVKLYYNGMPSYPIGLPGVVVGASFPDSQDLGVQGTTAADGTYTLGPVFDGLTYTVLPSSAPTSTGQSFLYSPASTLVTVAGADTVGVDFEAFIMAYPYLQRNAPGRIDSIVPGADYTWNYYITKSKSTTSMKVLVSQIQGGDVDLYLSRNGAPDETDYDYKSSNPGTTNEKLIVTPPSGVTYWCIGVRCMVLGGSTPISYKIRVTQPPQ